NVNSQGEGGALVDFASYGDRAAVQFGDFANQGEAETGSGRACILNPRDAIELFEDALQIGRRNAVALVGNFDQQQISFGPRGDRDGSAVGAVLDGVGDQVFDGAREQVGVGENGGKAGV